MSTKLLFLTFPSPFPSHIPSSLILLFIPYLILVLSSLILLFIPNLILGTNPASASMCGMKVVVVASDESGNIDLEDLRSKALKHKDHLVSGNWNF